MRRKKDEEEEAKRTQELQSSHITLGPWPIAFLRDPSLT